MISFHVPFNAYTKYKPQFPSSLKYVKLINVWIAWQAGVQPTVGIYLGTVDREGQVCVSICMLVSVFVTK